jgi:hypothetical protein
MAQSFESKVVIYNSHVVTMNREPFFSLSQVVTYDLYNVIINEGPFG